MKIQFNASLRLLLASFVTVACGASSTACSGPSDPPPFALDLEGQLQADTGVEWSLERGATRQVHTMMPVEPVKIGSGAPEEQAKRFLTKYAGGAVGTVNADALRAEPIDAPDPNGLTVVRMSHVVPGTDLPVFDHVSTATFKSSGELVIADADFESGIDQVDRTPTLSKSDAIQRAMAFAESHCGEKGEQPSEAEGVVLGVSADGEQSPHLAYRVTSSAEYEQCHSPTITVDARTGELLRLSDSSAGLVDREAKGVHYHAKKNASDTKPLRYAYSMAGSESKRILDVPAIAGTNEPWLPRIVTRAYSAPGVEKDIVANELGNWDPTSNKPGAAVDAHYHATRAFDFFRDFLHRRGIDNTGTTDLLVIVHDPSLGKQALDTGRTGLSFKRGFQEVITLGDGGPDWLPVTSFDILVHELTHGITRHTSGLMLANEPGALNDSFSDVMAATAEYWIQATKEPLKVTPTPTRIGEHVTANGAGIRDMVDPSIFKHASHYAGRYKCPSGVLPGPSNDQCGMHNNSGIPNRAWILLALGGTHPRTGVRVTGIGWERAGQLWFHTLTHLKPDTTMFGAASAMIVSAGFYGLDALTSTICAWHAVGVGDFRVAGFSSDMCARVAAATPKLSTATCSGVAFGYVCHGSAPNSAYVCVNGSIASGVNCLNTSKRCKKRAADDWSASYDVANGLACE
jgi:Zn-dependent metalloprotease